MNKRDLNMNKRDLKRLASEIIDQQMESRTFKLIIGKADPDYMVKRASEEFATGGNTYFGIALLLAAEILEGDRYVPVEATDQE